jgi:hypothetical protein
MYYTQPLVKQALCLGKQRRASMAALEALKVYLSLRTASRSVR